ncbi:MAG: sigma 54-interacting transcriptional regulator [Archangiaceae bacterium]|nr:sigma 54-interacting transcriptional regulator [Archangiaceae bacterium]
MGLPVSEQRPRTEAISDASAGQPLSLKLVVIAGPDFGRELKLDRGTYRIGKDPAADLPLGDVSVSHLHLLAEVLDQGVRLVDQGSTNGSFCEGMRFNSVDARPGVTVRLGRTVLKVAPAAEPPRGLPPSQATRFGDLVGESLAMRQVFAVLERLATSDADVLLSGETGTGKELCARSLHRLGARAKGPLVVCDLATAAPTLVESELFGHVKGAFTGAGADRAGPFETAKGGVVFLDEIGDLPLEVQPRLLRVLENRMVKRVGGADYQKVDVRVIAATQRDLEALVREGRFRQDLFFRLAVSTVRLPPLRERLADLPVLIDDMLARAKRSMGKLRPETLALLSDYAWPGNVRELRNAIDVAASLDQEPQLPAHAKRSGLESSGERGFHQAKGRLVDAFEADYVRSLLAECKGNVAAAARQAGLDRAYLHRLIKKHKLS